MLYSLPQFAAFLAMIAAPILQPDGRLPPATPPLSRPLAEQIAALPYTVQDLQGFHPIDVVGGLLLTAGAGDRAPHLVQPVVFIFDTGPRPDLRRDDFAVSVARQTYFDGPLSIFSGSIARRVGVTRVQVEGSAKIVGVDGPIHFALFYRPDAIDFASPS